MITPGTIYGDGYGSNWWLSFNPTDRRSMYCCGSYPCGTLTLIVKDLYLIDKNLVWELKGMPGVIYAWNYSWFAMILFDCGLEMLFVPDTNVFVLSPVNTYDIDLLVIE